MAKKNETEFLNEVERTEKIVEPVETPEEIVPEVEEDFETVFKKFKFEPAKLGLKIIGDLNDRRVQKPEETCKALTGIYNAIKDDETLTKRA